MIFPKTIQKLIDLFSKFPTVGPRTATRFVFYLLKLSEKDFNELINSLDNLKKTIKTCQFCFNSFEPDLPEQNLCSICRNPSRDKTLLCLVEKETDLISIENTKKYQGLYFVLGGNIPTLKKDYSENIRIADLEERIKNPNNFGLKNANFREIIIATNSTAEGEATCLFLERKLKTLQKEALKITHLGRGLPVGGELEYADEETLSSAFEGRK